MDFIEELRAAAMIPVLVGVPSHTAYPFRAPYLSFANGLEKSEGSASTFCAPSLQDAEKVLCVDTIKAVVEKARETKSVCLVVRDGSFGFRTHLEEWDTTNHSYRPARVEYRCRVAFITNENKEF